MVFTGANGDTFNAMFIGHATFCHLTLSPLWRTQSSLEVHGGSPAVLLA
jgi:hypothetical protein